MENRISQVLEYHGKLKKPSKCYLSINFFAKKIPYFLSLKSSKQNFLVSQNKDFSVISKYHLSITFLPQKKTVFSIPEKLKTITFQKSINIICTSTFLLKKDRIFHHRKIQKMAFQLQVKDELYERKYLIVFVVVVVVVVVFCWIFLRTEI